MYRCVWYIIMQVYSVCQSIPWLCGRNVCKASRSWDHSYCGGTMWLILESQRYNKPRDHVGNGSTYCSSIKVYLNPMSFYCQVTSVMWIHCRVFSMTHANRMDCIWTGTLDITVYTMQPPYCKDTWTSYRKR